MQKKENGRSQIIRKITLTAILTAMAVVVKCLLKPIPLSAIGIQLSFAGIFTFFPAAICGPLYGGIASALCDFLGAMIVPTGAYIPWLTICAFFAGFIKGLIWKILKKGIGKRTCVVLVAVFLIIGSVGIMFTVALNRDNVIDGVFIEQTELPTKDEISEMSENEELSSLSKAAVSLAKYNKNTEKNPDNYRKYLANYLTLLTVGLEFFAIVGVAFVTVGYLISRKGKEISFIKVFASIGIAGLIETTINTFILMLCISSYAGRSFLILWVPRLCQELAVTALQAMVIALLYGAILKTSAKKYLTL